MNKNALSKAGMTAWLLLALSLTGCAAPSPNVMPPLECPKPEIPELPPSLAKPPPQESFLDAARRDISEWLQQLKNSATR